MGYRENLEFYFNLSRKELQVLCKSHNLPANRSNSQLAKSLALFLRKENAASSMLRPLVPESNAKETVNPLEETTRGAFEKSNSSRIDNHGLASGINRKLNDDQPHSRTRNQMESGSHLIGQTSEKAYDTAANVVCSYPINIETMEGFGSSTSEPSDMGAISQVAAEIHHITAVPELHFDSNYVAFMNGSRKALELRSCGQKLPIHAVTNAGTSNMTPCGHKRAGDCSRESGFVSSDETSTKVLPSLQFFVMSEKGINLYVDLNHSPSEWINSLKDEVCIHPEAQNHESKTISTCISGLADADEHMKISPSGSTGICIQTNGAEKNTGCTNSSFSSVVSENCQSEACPQDATVVTSRVSVLTSSSIPVETSGSLEANQVVSSSCVTNSDVHDHMASDTTSCPRDEQVLHHDSGDASFRIDKSSSSIPDTSIKSVGNIDSSLDGNSKPETDECCTLKIASADFNNVEAGALDKPMNGICRRNNVLISNGMQDSVEASYAGYSENHSGACELPTERERMEVLPEATGHLKILSNSGQIDGQMLLDHPMTDAQSDAGSTDNLSNQHACGSFGNSVSDDPLSAFGDEMGKSNPMKGNDGSECSQFQNTFDKSSKRAHDPESAEELQSKRQHVCGEKSAMMNLRSSKTSAKETPCDPVVFPRRSTRLVSK
uniref:Uncharacterized protein LOC105034295 isoform X2 n=2 Tax=Elaeis guineensis var. tenera TaxID=51953 RepID=A0A6I9QDS8_ELAGV|nr:uncharacterized protein LOC105034295 isoform X2 [Elaeis guineensis]